MEDRDQIINDPKIKADRLRFTKNKIPSLLCYLAILFNVIYFIILYKINNEYFYTGMMAISIIANLAFLLAAFLTSEEIKSYKFSYAIVMLVLAVFQIVRIFIYPLGAYNTKGVDGNYVIEIGDFLTLAIMLIGSSAALTAGGVIGILKSRDYKKVMAEAQAKK